MAPRKKRIYLSIIALAALGLVVDRLAVPAPTSGAELRILRTPAQRSAEPPGTGISAEVGAASPGAILTATRFPNRLPEPQWPMRNLFVPTETVRRTLMGRDSNDDAVAAESGSGDVEIAKARAAQFALDHTLSAVVHDGEFAIAILDGAWVQTGQSTDGCTLMRVVGESALFDCGGAAVELSVARPHHAE